MWVMSDGSTVDTAAEAAGRRLRTSLLGNRQLVPLSIAHGVAAVGDAFVAISLAGSLFFSVSPDASRQQVLIYLLATMAPLAVLAPLVGPAVDRFRRSQRQGQRHQRQRRHQALLLIQYLVTRARYHGWNNGDRGPVC